MTARAGRMALAGSAFMVACASSGATEGASPFSSARRDDVVTVRAHNEIRHIAAGERMVFAASQSGVIIYDALFRSWLRPMESEHAFHDEPTILAADPTEDGVWVGYPGRVVYYRPRLEYAVTASVFGSPEEIFFDREDLGGGAYVRTRTSLVRLSRTGSSAQVPTGAVPGPEARLEAPSTRDVLRTYPGLETFLPLLTRDDDLEQWRVTAAAASPGRSEVWLGTYGNGVLRVDPTFNRAEEVPFGLVESGVGALAPAADGVWAGGLGRPGTRGALVFASWDLQRWRWLDGPRSRPFAGARVNAIAVRGQTAWIGTSRGLVRMDVEDDSRVSVWSATQGMPSDVVTSVVARADGAWVGTSAGLARVSETVRAVGPRVQVHGLAPWGDTLWIASSAGVSALVPGDSIPRTLALGDARLRRPIVAVARTDSVMIAVTAAAELIEIDVRAKRVLAPRAAAVSSLRTVAQVAVDAQTLWLAGEGGVLVIDRSTGRSTFLAAGSALPGPATAMIITREVAWVGTRDGLVRIRRRADGMPP
jgi:ligand-binding sensor domain-containing protein